MIKRSVKETLILLKVSPFTLWFTTPVLKTLWWLDEKPTLIILCKSSENKNKSPTSWMTFLFIFTVCTAHKQRKINSEQNNMQNYASFNISYTDFAHSSEKKKKTIEKKKDLSNRFLSNKNKSLVKLCPSESRSSVIFSLNVIELMNLMKLHVYVFLYKVCIKLQKCN